MGSYFFTFSEFSDRGFSARFAPCLFFLGWMGMIFAYFVLPTPSLSVGAGLGNRVPHLWHKIRFRSCRLDLSGSWRIPCYFSSCPTDSPPARELGAIWITLTTPTGEQDRLVFCVNISLFRRNFLSLPMLRVAWQ